MKRMIFVLASCMMLFGCFPMKYGLTPISPSDGQTVNSLKPTFAWEPYSDVKEGKENIRYRIFIKEDTTIVEYKGDIYNTSYTAEHQLLPNKEYNWCVQPTWTRNNHTEIGQCNYKQYYYFAVIVFGRTGGKPYTFKTPEK